MKQDRPETFTPWDAADYIQTVEDAAYHLEAASEEDGQVLLATLRNIARSESMSALAREAGIGRASLYRILTGEWQPYIGHTAENRPRPAAATEGAASRGLQGHHRRMRTPTAWSGPPRSLPTSACAWNILNCHSWTPRPRERLPVSGGW